MPPEDQGSLQVIVVVPVRVALGRQAIQSTTRALTASSVFVRALSRPLPGLRIPLRLYLPSGPPEDVLAVVVDRGVPQGESGFWADFVGISAGARARLDSLVASKEAAAGAVAGANASAAAGAATPGRAAPGQGPGPHASQGPGPSASQGTGPSASQGPGPGLSRSPGSAPVRPAPSSRPAPERMAPPMVVPAAPVQQSADTSRSSAAATSQTGPAARRATIADLRSTQRISAKLRVRFQTAAALREEISVNISAGGMFIRTDTPPPLREMVKVAIDLPGETQAIETQAEVVHRVTREEGRLTGRPAGAGVQFVEADDRFREALDAWLAKTQL